MVGKRGQGGSSMRSAGAGAGLGDGFSGNAGAPAAMRPGCEEAVGSEGAIVELAVGMGARDQSGSWLTLN